MKGFPATPYADLDPKQRRLIEVFAPVLFSDDQEMKKHILKQLQYLGEILKTREKLNPKKKRVGT